MALAKRAAALLLLAVWLGAGLPVAAADPYAVSGISVDVEAENAVTARELAIEQAQQDGLRRLLQRLTLPAYHEQLPSPGEASLSRLVSGYEVEEESLSATRYVGTLSVAYDAAAVQDLLQGTGVPIVVDLPPSLLVVPALDEASGMTVFNGPEGWRAAWAVEADRNTLLDIRLPLGDLADLRTLSSDALALQPQTALADAAARHGTDAAMLLVARADDPAAPTRVTVTMAESYNWPTDFAGESVAVDSEPQVVWEAAARRTKEALENEWKAQNLVSTDQLARTAVTVPLGSLDTWADIRRRLGQVAAIRRIEIEQFSQADASLVFNHVGNIDQLQRALAARGLGLVEGTGTWRLQRAAGQPAG
jgi:hypothetical protein